MKIEDIISLTNAGWSKREIMRLAGIENKPTPEVNPPEEKPAEKPPEEKHAEKPPEEKPAEKHEENETLSLLRNLTQMMQRNNINNMQNPTPEQPDAAELLAKILD